MCLLVFCLLLCQARPACSFLDPFPLTSKQLHAHTRPIAPVFYLSREIPPGFGAPRLLPWKDGLSSSNADDPEIQGRSSDSGGIWQPEKILTSIARSLWKGVTIPFPQLRDTLKSQGGNQNIGIGLKLRECVAFLFSYLTVGVLAYSVVFEKWSVVDSLYFTSVCFSTVGYGDLCPTTVSGRLFTCFFGLAGIAFLGAAVATICSTFVKAEVEAVKKVETAGKRRVLNLFRDMPKTVDKFRKSSEGKQKELLNKANKHKKETPKWASNVMSKFSCLNFLKSFIPSLAIIHVGGAIMGYLNGGWTFLESMYYAIITASTIGLGDFAPQTRNARMFAIFFIPLSVGAAGELLSSIATALVQRRQKRAYQQEFQANLTIQHLRAMDTDGDGGVDREEYVFFMLKEMGLVSQDDLDELFRQFEGLDVTNSGVIDQDDLKLMAKLKGAQVLE